MLDYALKVALSSENFILPMLDRENFILPMLDRENFILPMLDRENFILPMLDRTFFVSEWGVNSRAPIGIQRSFTFILISLNLHIN